MHLALRNTAVIGVIVGWTLGMAALTPAMAGAVETSSAVAAASATPTVPPAHTGDVTDPVADPKAVVVLGKVRFTVLTPQLIRMEWAADGKFEDHASFVFINRCLPVP